MLTKETAKSLVICYEQIENAISIIDTINDNITKYGIDFKNTKHNDLEEKKFALTVQGFDDNNQNVIKSIQIDPIIALQLARKTKKSLRNKLKVIMLTVCRELGSSNYTNLLPKVTAMNIHNQYYIIADANKFKESVKNRIANDKIKMQLRGDWFASNLCLSIPLNDKSSTIEQMPQDLSLEIIDNYIEKQNAKLVELCEDAKKIIIS